MAEGNDLSRLSDFQRMEKVGALAEELLLSVGQIKTLSALGDKMSLLTAAERYKAKGYQGPEYYMAQYELARDAETLDRRIELLNSLRNACPMKEYILELAGLYCLQGSAPMAKRTCVRLIDLFKAGPETDKARDLLELLQNGKIEEAARRYSAYAAPPSRAPASKPVKPAASKAAEAEAKSAVPKAPAAKPAPSKPAEAKPAAPKASGPKPVPPKPAEPKPAAQPPSPPLPPEIERAFRDIVGMTEVKYKLRDIYNKIAIDAERTKRLNAPPSSARYNFLLLGNPGTGKTTVARILAKMLFELHVRRENKLVEVDRSKLVGQFIGDTEKQTTQYLERALGGTLFVDEAYTLYKQNAPNDFGHEALNVIMKYMEDHHDDLSVIFAGYQESMSFMFKNANPGLASRFSTRIVLPDYTDAELLQIAHKKATSDKYVFGAGADTAFLNRLEQERVGENFGNVRVVDNLLDAAKQSLCTRLSALPVYTERDLTLLLPEDFKGSDAGKENLDDLLDELNGYTGLKRVKEQIHSLVKDIQQQQKRSQELDTKSVPLTFCAAFLGNPGTGKTTVAKLLYRICRSLGVLKRSDIFVEAKREDLVSGNSAETTKELVKKAMGGMLFIDEAYGVCTGPEDKAGLNAVNTLIAEIENHRGDLVVILAGYTEEMNEFFSQNSGFKSRVSHFIDFEDYSIEQLMDIFEGILEKESFTLEPGWRTVLEPVIRSKLAVVGSREFANARGVRNLAVEARSHYAGRDGKDNRITLDDLVWKTDNRETAERLLAQLDAMVGLESVKQEVHKQVSSLKVRKLRQEKGMRDTGFQTLHMAFLGNPGTGKTSVARIIGKLYTALGILPGQAFVECDRSSLVSGFVGQTAQQTKARVKEAMGGVLFIDEIYSLVTGDNDHVGKEALNTLLKVLEDSRGGFMAILAGYTKEMEEFFSINPGLKSRVPTQIVFEDYTQEQLLEIFRSIVERDMGFSLPAGWELPVGAQLERLRSQAGQNFGNAREVRNLVQQAQARLDERIASEADAGRELTREDLSTFSLDDLTFSSDA